MKAPEGFAKRARALAEGLITGNVPLLALPRGMDANFAVAWMSRGELPDSLAQLAIWWLLLAELADDGQESP